MRVERVQVFEFVSRRGPLPGPWYFRIPSWKRPNYAVSIRRTSCKAVARSAIPPRVRPYHRSASARYATYCRTHSFSNRTIRGGSPWTVVSLQFDACLGGHLRSGHQWTPEDRPPETHSWRTQDPAATGLSPRAGRPVVAGSWTSTSSRIRVSTEACPPNHFVVVGSLTACAALSRTAGLLPDVDLPTFVSNAFEPDALLVEDRVDLKFAAKCLDIPTEDTQVRVSADGDHSFRSKPITDFGAWRKRNGRSKRLS